MAYTGANRFDHKNHPQQVNRRNAGSRLFENPDANDTTDVDDRATDDKLWRKLDDEFHFTVDVAAAAHNRKCERYYDREMDGLNQPWEGEIVWCNPPYSDIKPWVRKAHENREATVVMLVPANRTEQGWWQDYIEPNRDGEGRLRTRFIRGRTRFFAADGSKKGSTSPPFGCVLLVWEALT